MINKYNFYFYFTWPNMEEISNECTHCVNDARIYVYNAGEVQTKSCSAAAKSLTV